MQSSILFIYGSCAAPKNIIHPIRTGGLLIGLGINWACQSWDWLGKCIFIFT